MITTSHWTRRTALLLFGIAIGFTVFLTLGAAPVSADDDPDVDRRTGEKLGKRQTIIYDQFKLKRGQAGEMEGREPDKVSIGTLWTVELGDWFITGKRGGQVVEQSPEDWYPASDKRVNIGAESANVKVSSRIKRGSGTQYFGVTARHKSDVDWLGAWFDPLGWPAGPGQSCPNGQERCGAIVLGAKDQSTAPDQFIELRRARYEWRPGKKHTIALTVVDDQVRVSVDRRVLIEREFEGLGDATEVGLFSRGAGDAEFEDFVASGRDRLEPVTKKGKEESKR